MSTHTPTGVLQSGENVGNIVGCLNRADVNISSEDKARSLEDIDLGQYTTGLLSSLEGGSDEKSEKLSATENTAVREIPDHRQSVGKDIRTVARVIQHLPNLVMHGINVVRQLPRKTRRTPRGNWKTW